MKRDVQTKSLCIKPTNENVGACLVYIRIIPYRSPPLTDPLPLIFDVLKIRTDPPPFMCDLNILSQNSYKIFSGLVKESKQILLLWFLFLLIYFQETISFSYFPSYNWEKLGYYIKWIQLPRLRTPTLNIVYTLYGNMEGKIHFPKKPAAGAARIGSLYRSPPWKCPKISEGGGGSVRKSCDVP